MKDVWFAQHKGKLYMAVGVLDTAPQRAVRVLSVHSGLAKVRKKNVQIANIGICSPEMLGLE